MVAISLMACFHCDPMLLRLFHRALAITHVCIAVERWSIIRSPFWIGGAGLPGKKRNQDDITGPRMGHRFGGIGLLESSTVELTVSDKMNGRTYAKWKTDG